MTAQTQTFTLTPEQRAHLVALGETPASIDTMTADKMQAIFAEFGGPAAHTNGNGKPPGPADDDDLAQELDDMLKAAQVDPPGQMTAAKIVELLPIFEDYAWGGARETAIKALRTLIEPLPAVERAALEVPLREHLFKENKDFEAFMASCPRPPGTPRFTPFSFSDLMQRPPKEWIIDQVLGRGDLVAIFGPPGSGKTMVVVDAIFAACLGQQFAMRFDVARPLNVAYTAGEGLSGLPERFKAAATKHNVTDYLPGFTFFETVPQLYQDNGDGIGAFVAEWSARQADNQAPALDILIIDTLHSATVGADENSAQDMGQVLSAAKHAIKELGCAVLLVHHTNKNGTAERGSSALRGAMDCMIQTQETAGKYSMSCEKLKDGEAWKPQTFSLIAVDGCESVRVWWDEPSDGAQATGAKAADKDTLRAELGRYAGTQFTAKSMAEVLGKSENYTRNLLVELVKMLEIERGLQDPDKPQSNRNPWVYFVESTEAKAEATGL